MEKKCSEYFLQYVDLCMYKSRITPQGMLILKPWVEEANKKGIM